MNSFAHACFGERGDARRAVSAYSVEMFAWSIDLFRRLVYISSSIRRLDLLVCLKPSTPTRSTIPRTR